MTTRQARKDHPAALLIGQILVFAILLALFAKAAAVVGVVVGVFAAYKIVTAR